MNKNQESIGNHSKGLVVITGCDSGIGKSLVEILIREGYTVAQSFLEQNQFENVPRVYSKKMDLRLPEEVDDFCRYVQGLYEKGERLEALVVNAGVALGGPVEDLPLTLYRECFEINYFGAVRIVQACIPELIRNKGKIIVNGSMAGKFALPFLSPYASSKFALEGFCDSLRREMNPFGVKTVLLEPAAVATPIWNKAKSQDTSFIEEKYLKSVTFFMNKFIEGG
ncbi:MAG: SDR family NAD(P)-dependent oxidoreductase, partial [Actinobacteria bacterium]|nr:SDR family NAD(P)-dependent oxidoreductase [Actinomycetota bacterium]